jgi:hypothetical protein
MQESQVQAGLFGQERAGKACFGFSELGQVDIDPSREEVLCVPGGLPVTEEDEIEHPSMVLDRHGLAVARWCGPVHGSERRDQLRSEDREMVRALTLLFDNERPTR